MKTINWHTSIGGSGGGRTDVIEVEDENDATEKEIEALLRDENLQDFEWSWLEKKSP